MNTTDADIAGIKAGEYAIHQTAGCLFLDTFHGCEVTTQYISNPDAFLAFCRAVVDKVDGPAKPINIERIIYALQLWMKRIVMGIPVHSQEGWEVRWERLEKVIEDWKTKGEMPT